MRRLAAELSHWARNGLFCANRWAVSLYLLHKMFPLVYVSMCEIVCMCVCVCVAWDIITSRSEGRAGPLLLSNWDRSEQKSQCYAICVYTYIFPLIHKHSRPFDGWHIYVIIANPINQLKAITEINHLCLMVVHCVYGLTIRTGRASYIWFEVASANM